jgi:hypothetical protein
LESRLLPVALDTWFDRLTLAPAQTAGAVQVSLDSSVRKAHIFI